jgi:transposase
MDPEKVLNEILYILWTGAPWRSLNAKGASHFQTVHGHFMAWARKGVFKRAYAIALRHLIALSSIL